MAQTITTKYQEFDTSAIQNQRYVNVVPAGVYTGYNLNVNTGITYTIDIVPTPDAVSTLVTNEGVVVTETTALTAAVKLSPADPSFNRIDLIVAEYQYSTNPADQQVYKVVRGPNQLNGSQDPVRPPVQNAYQIPLGYVYVRAGSSFLIQEDVIPVERASWTKSDTWTDFQSVIATGNNTLVYVYPGTFAKSDGTSVLEFPGGYSTAISDDTFLNNTERWYLFGITDTLDVVTAGYADTESELADTSTDVFVVCKARVRMINSRAELLSVEDLRTPFSRSGFKQNEALKYQDLLATSVFRYLRVEDFDNLDDVATTTVENGSLELDSAGSALNIYGTAASEVSFVTEDIIEGSNISVVNEFMLAVDSLIQNLTFDYSVVSPLSGFTGNRYSTGEFIKVPGDFASKLFIKFYVPAAEFAMASLTKMFSYGVLINLENSAINAQSISQLGIRDLTNSINNLIANGDFYYWSKNTILGKEPELITQSDLIFPISDDSPEIADGWQFTNINGSFDGGSVSRIFLNNVEDNTTGLSLTFSPDTASQSSDPTALEYRIPRSFELSGKRVSFAINYDLSNAGSATIGVAQFQRTSVGLVKIQEDSRVLTRNSGTGTVITAAGINTNTSVISFFIKFSSTVPISATLWHARAAVGEFATLPYTYVVGAEDTLRSYFERGTFFQSSFAQSGSLLGGSMQFGSPKHLELGDLTARTVPSATGNRSSNTENIAYTATRNSLIVSATATSSGSTTIQTDWEAFVRYTGSVV